MNKFKFDVYVIEFPFLRKIIGGKNALDITSIAVKRADENLLNRTPKVTYHDGGMGETNCWEKVHFVLFDGSLLPEQVAPSGSRSSNYAYSQSEEWEGESVLEALSYLENPDDVQYIIWETKDYSNWSGSETVDDYHVVIYKPLKGVSFGELIEKARAKALAEVRAEADF